MVAAVRRLTASHYFGYQILAILVPPSIFLLCPLPGRCQLHDIRLNLVLLLLGWIGAIIHASIYLSDAYQVGREHGPRYFQDQRVPTLPEAQRAYDPATIIAPSSALAAGAPGLSGMVHDTDDSPLKRPSRPSMTPSARTLYATSEHWDPFPDHRSPHSSSTNTTNTALTGRSWNASLFSLLSAGAGPASEDHKTHCTLCFKCSACFKQHMRYLREQQSLHRPSSMLDPSSAWQSTPDHSHQWHRNSKHHVRDCVCAICRSSELIPMDWGIHSRGCVCELCKPSRVKSEVRVRPWLYSGGLNASGGAKGTARGSAVLGARS